MFKRKNLILLCFAALLIFLLIFYTPYNSTEAIIPSDYVIISTENTFKSRYVYVESYNKNGELIDKIKLHAPLAWSTSVENNYINIYGSNNYYIIDTISGNVFFIDNVSCIEDSCIIGNNLFLMSNDGVSKDKNTYHSSLHRISLDKDLSSPNINMLSFELDTVPYGIFADNDKLYYLCATYNNNFDGSDIHLEEYDLNFNRKNRYQIESNFNSLLGSHNNNIILSSIDEYLFFPSMIRIQTPVEFDRFSTSMIIGEQLLRKTYSSYGKEVWLENINDDFSISPIKLYLKKPDETLCSVSSEEIISTQTYQENVGKIYFFNIKDNSYDSFEYTIQDDMKVIGAYSLT